MRYRTETHRHKQYGGYQREGVEDSKGKWGRIHDGRGRYDCGWWAHDAVHRSWIIEMHTELIPLLLPLKGQSTPFLYC